MSGRKLSLMVVVASLGVISWSARQCFAPYGGVGIDTSLTPIAGPEIIGGSGPMVDQWDLTVEMPADGEVETGDFITIDAMPGFEGFAPSGSLGLDSATVTDIDGGTWNLDYSAGEITETYSGDNGTEVGSGSGDGNAFVASSFFDIFTDLSIDSAPWQSQDVEQSNSGSLALPGAPLPTTLLGGGALLAGLALIRVHRSAKDRK